MDMVMYDDLIRGILSTLQDQVLRIVLYGSAARGTNSEESDIDIAVFVRSRIDRHSDDMLSAVIVDLNLKYGKVFSVVDIEDETYRIWRHVTPFYQNVDKEGIVLWRAA